MTSCNLNGQWRLTSPQRPELSIPMTVPGDNVTALLAAQCAEESPDDLDKNHQVKVDAHLVI
ncbi:hypothetical protein [Vibrio mimicus]|uniref:hypothetical protein n=1 Tax=Vibrio mimicus TaxID=674 RepID=UPI000A7A7521|nr:hypothetical protein [Vibrio mimicus]AUW38553.1 hypothetical protein AL543_21765 [Vibrio mimicus]